MQLQSGGGYDQHSHASGQLGDSPWGPTPPAFAQLPRIEYVMTPSDKSAQVSRFRLIATDCFPTVF